MNSEKRVSEPCFLVSNSRKDCTVFHSSRTLARLPPPRPLSLRKAAHRTPLLDWPERLIAEPAGPGNSFRRPGR